MSNAAFDRVILNPREKPVSSDINQALSQDALTLREVLRSLFLPHNLTPTAIGSSFTPVSGFLGDAFFPTAGGVLTYTLKAGMGFLFDAGSIATDIDSISKLDDRSPYYPVYLAADQTITSPAAPGGGLERLDIIEVKLDRRRADADSRDQFDNALGKFTPQNLLKTLAYALDGRTGVVTSPASSTTGIGLKAGANQASGTFNASGGVTGIPATTAGYTRIAVILVTSAGAVAQKDIRDDRLLVAPGGVHEVSFQILQVPGSPNDTIAIGNGPQTSAGFRIAARQLSSPSNGGPMRVYIFGGKINSNFHGSHVAQITASVTTNSNRIARCTAFTTGTVADATEQSALSGAGSSGIEVQVGQPYASFDIDTTKLIDVGDPVDTNRLIQVRAALSFR